jgi:hypothetical protein
MRQLLPCLFLPFLVLLGSCEMSAGSQYRSARYQERPRLETSLIQSEHALLSEEAIQKLLDSRIELPEKSKLSVHALPGENDNYSSWSWRVAWHEQSRRLFLDLMAEPLEGTGRFVEISHVPSLLLPGNPDLVRLREAAALMQSELLLVYKTSSTVLTDPGFLWEPDEVRARGTVEFLLMDVRTAAIPFAEVIDVEQKGYQKSGETTVEAQLRVRREAFVRAMRETGSKLAEFVRP